MIQRLTSRDTHATPIQYHKTCANNVINGWGTVPPQFPHEKGDFGWNLIIPYKFAQKRARQGLG